MDSQPLTAGEIEELRRIAALEEPTLHDLAEVASQLDRIVEALTPPTDAAVREAVEDISIDLSLLENIGGDGVNIHRMKANFDTLASAVQSHRDGMVCEVHGFVPGAEDCYRCTIDRLYEENNRLRATLRARLDGFADPVNAAITIIVAHEAKAVQRADAVHLAKANPTQAYQRIQQFKERTEAAEARLAEEYAELVKVMAMLEQTEARVRELEAENALIAESYKKAHEEVVRLRMEMRRSGADD